MKSFAGKTLIKNENENFKYKQVWSKFILSFILIFSIIFIKVFNNTDINLYKSNILFISGNSFQDVAKLTSLIRNYKLPEPYKGKGILYENEIINLKEGKKV